MSKRERLFMAAVALSIAVTVVVLLAVIAWTVGPWGCEARWPDNETRWTLGAMCQVNVDGAWVPSTNVRAWQP